MPSGNEIIRPNNSNESVLHRFPNTAPSYDKIYEVIADEDTTYVFRSGFTNGTRDVYTWGDMVAVPGRILKITHTVRARKTTTAACTIQSLLKKALPLAYIITDMSSSLTTSYANYSLDYILNPFTGLGWTITDINAILAGLRVVIPVNGELRVTQTYITVYYDNGEEPVVSLAVAPSLSTSFSPAQSLSSGITVAKSLSTKLTGTPSLSTTLLSSHSLLIKPD